MTGKERRAQFAHSGKFEGDWSLLHYRAVDYNAYLLATVRRLNLPLSYPYNKKEMPTVEKMRVWLGEIGLDEDEYEEWTEGKGLQDYIDSNPDDSLGTWELVALCQMLSLLLAENFPYS